MYNPSSKLFLKRLSCFKVELPDDLAFSALCTTSGKPEDGKIRGKEKKGFPPTFLNGFDVGSFFKSNAKLM